MADILTRREARQQAKQNRGYNRSQFQTAMINAKKALRDNSNLRGRELRQTARRMVAGTGEYAPSSLPPTFEEWINSPVLAGRPSAGGAEAARAAVQRGISKANKIDAITPIVNPDTNFSGLAGRPQQEPPTADLTGAGNFNNAFALARKNGMKVFTWNGKKYGTKTDPNWRQRWGLDGGDNGSKISDDEISSSAHPKKNYISMPVLDGVPDEINATVRLIAMEGQDEIDRWIAQNDDDWIRNVIKDNKANSDAFDKWLNSNTFFDSKNNYVGPMWHVTVQNPYGDGYNYNMKFNPFRYRYMKNSDGSGTMIPVHIRAGKTGMDPGWTRDDKYAMLKVLGQIWDNGVSKEGFVTNDGNRTMKSANSYENAIPWWKTLPKFTK